MISEDKPQPVDPAVADALEALECAEVLTWISESAATSGGRQEVLALLHDDSAPAAAHRRLRGMEAMAAERAEHSPSLARCSDVVGLAGAARKRVLDGLELLGIAETVGRINDLRRWAAQHPEFPELGAVILAAPVLDDLRERIRKSIDPRGKVNDDADPSLPVVVHFSVHHNIAEHRCPQ